MEPILTCKGLSIGQLRIPSFHLMPGECLCLRWPVRQSDSDYRTFLNILMGRLTSEPITVRGQLGVTDPVWFQWRILGSRRLADTLLPRTSTHILTILENLHILSYWMVIGDRRIYIDNELETTIRELVQIEKAPLTALSGNHRNLVSIHQNCLDKDIIVYSTIGCDLSFYEILEGYVRERGRGKTLLQFQFPTTSRQYPSFRNAPIIEVEFV